MLISLQLQLGKLMLPEGFNIAVYATDVKNARQLALGTQGTVFVGTRRQGEVYALVDSNKDGKADQKYTIDHGLNMPSGVAFKDGDLYVAAVNRILRYRNIEQNLSSPPSAEVIIDDLPNDKHHGWKAIEFNDQGHLIIPVGVPCNICISDDKRHGTLLELDLKTRQYRVYAEGVRNSVGLTVHPVDKSLWFTDNGRDWMGDDLPPDEINKATRAGLHFGFPYLHGSSTYDPNYKFPADLKDISLPVIDLGAHVAPLGLTFYSAKKFPESYNNSLFVAEHGSWNRSEKSGYRVINIKFGYGDKTVTPFVTGWLDKNKDEAWGRPVDILQLTDGSLLISDDYADTIYRIDYHKPDE